MNKIIFGLLISVTVIFVGLIFYLGSTEIIVEPKLIEKEIIFNYEK